ncbi:sensor histidine kinase [Streptomyces canus]|uniref:sensor histidine kinase n=1 Tax=Streptomyces canus TaxID=58343 RepID=UPI002787CB2E|nr:sensor histidine kinase [Streptomyces canus]MDQ0765025.1 signal transduction histidine kinase [Streptomyces canus]MDQ1066540.1 signal transduction histidine kinase [Streptomyces canus]
MNRAEKAHPQVTRWGVPALCTAFGLPSLLDAADGPGVPAVLALIAGLTIPLLWRRQHPMTVYAITAATAVAALPLGILTAADAGRLVALLNVGRRGTARQLVVALAVGLAQGIAAYVVYSDDGQIDHFLQAPALILITLLDVVAIAGLGVISRLVNSYITALQDRAVRLEVERDQRARLAAAAERARIAREMHDILGHTLSVVVGLAGGAAGLTENEPRRGADTLRLIADSGRGALGDLRRLLTVIHDEPGEPGPVPPLAPQPGLADLDALLERVRSAGPSATLHTEGDLEGLAPGLQLVVYRIVQEALTNTLKHAAPAPTVQVAVCVGHDLVHVTIEDTGPHRLRHRADRSDGGGQGLVGMRQRAALYQGSITAGPNTRGGWTVRALLIPTAAPFTPPTPPPSRRTRPQRKDAHEHGAVLTAPAPFTRSCPS